jgi:CheY-like chemotaxis protein
MRAQDGTLWFPTIKGAVTMRPNKLIVNTLPPSVVIERIAADRRTVTLSGDIRMPPGHGELEFRYTALSFVVPADVRFKYRLKGFDRDWVDAGRRRDAHYTNLPAGSYQFQVVAQNNDGVWNEHGASVSIRLEPHFYETPLFYVTAALAMRSPSAVSSGCACRIRQRRRTQRSSTNARALRGGDRAPARRRALRRANEATASRQGQFLANAARDRTPMNGIIGMTNLALGTVDRRATRSSTWCSTRQTPADDHQRHSDFSKIESGKLQLDPARFALRTMLRETMNPLAVRAREKGLQFALDVDPSVPDTLVGDHGRSAGSDQPGRQRDQVHSCWQRHRERLCRGGAGRSARAGALCGRRYRHRYPPEKHASSSSRSDRRTVRRRASRARASASRSVERWSTCSAGASGSSDTSGARSIHGPARESAPVTVVAPAASSAAPASRTGEVLLAEDNAVNQLLAKRLLERWGHQVVVAETGRQAVAAHARQKFDVILMDVQMPEMNGFEATAAIRAAEGTSDGTPIVAMTAHAMKGDRERCLSEGMDDYIAKPVGGAALSEVIERALTSRMSPAFEGEKPTRATDSSRREQIARQILQARVDSHRRHGLSRP